MRGGSGAKPKVMGVVPACVMFLTTIAWMDRSDLQDTGLVHAQVRRSPSRLIDTSEELVTNRPSLFPPLEHMVVTSGYGPRTSPLSHRLQFHKGIDLAAEIGTPIFSIFPGTVVYAGVYAGYGKLVVIAHESGVTTHYAHCEEVNVNVGDQIGAGTMIGRVGETGLTTGPHLHFEMRANGNPVPVNGTFLGMFEKQGSRLS